MLSSNKFFYNFVLSIAIIVFVFYSSLTFSKEKFENILDSIDKFLNKNNSKKLKIILFLNKPLAVNNHGVLSIDQNIKLEIINLKLIFPII